jgi:AraC-like DNA-binding protein
MHKNKKSIRAVELVKGFFAVNFNRWIVVSSVAALSGIYLYFFLFRPVVIFPGRNNVAIAFFTDSASGGNSTILSHAISDTAIDFDFELKDGFMSPYVGMTIGNKDDSVFHLAPYNRLYLDIAGEQVNSIGIGIFADAVSKNTALGEREVCFYENLNIASIRKHYEVDLNELNVADWWYGVNNIPLNERFEPTLNHVHRINISPAYTSASDIKHSLRVYSLTIERDNSALIVFLILIEAVLMLVLVITHYIRYYYRNSVAPLTITYKAVAVDHENEQANSFLHYINNNFHDYHLTLERVSSQTGINQRRIATSIQHTFGCNFKTYVNRLRINEAKRLLKESGLNMGEIAFKVGFNNQTHFNRVFKSLEGTSPSEFLENKQR